MKKLLALILAVLMTVSLFAGCTGGEPDTSYAITAKVNGETVTFPVEPYLYYLQWMRDYYYAYMQTVAAQSQKKLNWEEVLKSTALTAPDTLSQFLVKTAQDQYMAYLYVEETFKELGLTLSAEDEKAIDQIIQQDWVSLYGHDTFNTIRQNLGMTYDEFRNLMASNIKSEKIVEYYYGEGGVEEIAEEEMLDYYRNNYVRFKYVIFMTKDSDGNKYGSDKIKEIEGKRDAALAELAAGTSFEDVLVKYSEDYTDITDKDLTASEKEALELQNKTMLEEGLIIDDKGVFSETLATYYNITVDEDIVEEVFSMKDGEYQAVTIDDSIWIVKRYSVDEEESYFEGVKEQVFKALYSEDLSAKHTAWRQKLDYTYNQAVLDKYTPETLTDMFDFSGTGAAQ